MDLSHSRIGTTIFGAKVVLKCLGSRFFPYTLSLP
jgi:hypothetical protein